MAEQIEHPDYYNWIPGIECWQVVRWFSFNCGGAIKYIWRAGKKSPDAVTDLKKAVQLLQDEIALEEYKILQEQARLEKQRGTNGG